MCINLIARFQPTAQDLRTIIMILKMNNDLERIADMAENISESALIHGIALYDGTTIEQLKETR